MKETAGLAYHSWFIDVSGTKDRLYPRLFKGVESMFVLIISIWVFDTATTATTVRDVEIMTIPGFQTQAACQAKAARYAGRTELNTRYTAVCEQIS